MPLSDAFDLVVIGSGPGGYTAAVRAAQLGMRAAVVERDPEGCGGTCLLRGCVPTKTLLHTAELLDDMRNARAFGIVADSVDLNFTAVMERKSHIVRRLSRGVENHLFKKNGVALFKGTGRLDGPRKVIVDSVDVRQPLDADAVVIAAGSKPRDLPGVSIDGRRIMTSDHILELRELPQSLIVIGAGAVGIELASIFARFGSVVTVLEALPRILPSEDEEISAEAARALGKQMKIVTSARVESVAVKESGVDLVYSAGEDAPRTISAELALVAVGRAPVSDDLGIETTRARLDRGFIRVNATLETEEPGVYAIGDVVTLADRPPHPQFAHVASHEGVGVVERLTGRSVEPLNYDLVPSATYCSPEVASVGLSEAAARLRGRELRIGRFPFANLAKPRIIGREAGFVKIVADARYDEILGVHMIGPHATDLIAEACLALRLEATTEEIARTLHAHPTLPEALMQAAAAVQGSSIDA
ncbi:MAG: dihydrolipoyl dehydrogenase [Vicinamibacteria bacterium]|nr:dihydrolipoyl dehydrogenase [Vicinamibacteria bacterium]